jgi:amino acid adenylation domain-containing protein
MARVIACYHASSEKQIRSNNSMGQLGSTVLDTTNDIQRSIAEIEDTYPLSPMQQGMLFNTLLDPGSGVDIEQLLFELHETIDVVSFQRAWHFATARHPVLRTNLRWEYLDEPRQEVHSWVELPWEDQDWQGFAVTEREERFAALLGADRRRGFDLTNAPLWRLTILRYGMAEWRLIWTFHHTILEGRSYRLVLREVFAFYESFCRGEEPTLPVPRPYRDYIDWLQQQDFSKAETFWRQTLKGFSTPTPLAIDYAPGAEAEIETHQGAHEIKLSADITSALRTLVQQNQLTLNTIVQGAWALLLNRYSGEADIVFGVVRGTRQSTIEGAEAMIGLFLNTLPLRVFVKLEQSLIPWLKEVRSQWMAMRSHEHTPLANVQAWSEVPRGGALFQSTLMFENYHLDTELRKLGGAWANRRFRLFLQTNYLFNVAAYDGTNLRLRLDFDHRRVDGVTARRMLKHLQTIIESMAAKPQQTVGELPLVDADERRQLLAACIDTAPAIAATTLPQLFAAQVEKTPDAVAVVFEEHSLSYRELDRRANQLAHHLRDCGVGPEVVAALCLERSHELVVGMIGILKAGGAYLPLDPAYPRERLDFMINDAGATVLVTHSALRDRLGTNNACIVRIDADASAIAERSAVAPTVQLDANNPAYVMYTSGSTGQPKAVVVEHQNVVRLFGATEHLFHFDAHDVWTLFHSFAFDVSVWETWGALLSGGRLVVVPYLISRSPLDFLRLITREGVTVLNQTPAAFYPLMQTDLEQSHLSRLLALRYVIFAGEALDLQKLDQWYQRHPDSTPLLINMYGITETTVHVTHIPLHRAVTANKNSLIGHGICDLRVYLLDTRLEPVPAGVPGELYIAGAGLTRGYLRRPDLTAIRFVADPHGPPGSRMYRSGDLARRRSDGVLEFIGRADAQVKLRGFRIELGEIEAALIRLGDVAQAAVVVREDEFGDKQLVGYVVSTAGAILDSASLRATLLDVLPDYMVPSAVGVLESFPLTPNGKLDRRALPALTAVDLRHPAGGEPPHDELERALAEIFAEVLGRAVTTRDSDFFRLGGHSLLVLRVVAQCQTRLGIELPVKAVYSHPSVAAVADFLRQEKPEGRSATEMTRVSREGAQALTPQQYALWLELKLRSDENAYNVPLAFRVELHLTPERVRGAMEKLAELHEMLRARLVEQEGEPCFVFDGVPAAPELEEVDDSSALSAAVRRPFDLSRGPLWRAALHHSQGSTVLLLVVHHIILDAASEEILLRDFATVCTDPEAALPNGGYDFFDLASYERKQLAAEQAALERFWGATLGGAELTLELPPPCVPCAPGEEEHGYVTRRALPPALIHSINACAAELGTTPFHVYLAAYLTLLRTYTANDDLVVGSPLSLRETPAAQNVVGYLLSPVTLRVRLPGSLSFRHAVEEVSRRWQEVRTHARLPMHLVLQAAGGGRRMGVGSPVQVFFSLVHDLNAGLSIDGKPLLPVNVRPPLAKFQLFLLVEERAEDTSLLLEFQRGTLDPEMAERLLAQLELLLHAATEQRDTPISKLPLAEPSELERLRALGSCERPYARDKTVPDVFEDVVRRYGDATALVAGSVEVSYSALDRRANSVAAALRRAGVTRGDRVPLLLGRGPRFITSALGVLKCGAAFVPLEPDYPTERLTRMLEGLGARVGLRASGVELPASGICWLDASCADQESLNEAPPREFDATDAAYVMFTSGSTGKPKGVEVPHRAIVRLVQAQDFVRMGPHEAWLHMAPTSFDASTLEIWAALLHGGRCVVLEESLPTPALLAETIRRHGVTSAWFTAALFNVLVDEAPQSFTGLQQILIGGEALSPGHVRRAFEQLPGVRFVNGYGPTENTTFTCCHLITREDVDSGRAIPIGRPIANTSVFVLDCDGRPAPLGMPGELVTGGDGLALGYTAQPAETATRFIPDTLSGQVGGRLYRTGDRVRWRTDGVIEFLGRYDDQVKIRGFRVEPGEIVACLSEHPNVRQAAVVPRRTGAGATHLVAYAVPRDSASTGEFARLLRAHAAQRLPGYMCPAEFMFLNRLPLKSNGKLDVEALEVAARHSQSQDVPLTLAETKVLAIWREALNNPMLGANDDFFAVGGDSLLAIRMIVRVERELGMIIPVRALVEGRTVRRIATLLANSIRSALPEGMVRLREGDLERPLFCLPGLGGSALQFERLAAKLRTRRVIYAVEFHNLDLGHALLESLVDMAVATARLIREVQPEGPYCLIGYSYGGNLAVEVARLLSLAGQRVEFLAVLDAYASGSIRVFSGIRRMPRLLRHLWRMRWDESYAYLTALILRRMKLKPQKPESDNECPNLQSDLERKLPKIFELGKRAVHSHRPNPFEQRIVLVQTTVLEYQKWKEIMDPSGTCGWGPICKGGIDLIQIGCTHDDLLAEPNISELARRLNSFLDARPSTTIIVT